jgi:hypothetical protein
VVNSPPFQISIRKWLEVQDDSLAMRTIRDLHGCHLDRPVRAQEAALQTELIHNLRARSVPHLGTLGEDHFRVLDRRLELGAAVLMEF